MRVEILTAIITLIILVIIYVPIFTSPNIRFSYNFREVGALITSNGLYTNPCIVSVQDSNGNTMNNVMSNCYQAYFNSKYTWNGQIIPCNQIITGNSQITSTDLQISLNTTYAVGNTLTLYVFPTEIYTCLQSDNSAYANGMVGGVCTSLIFAVFIIACITYLLLRYNQNHVNKMYERLSNCMSTTCCKRHQCVDGCNCSCHRESVIPIQL